MRDRQTLINQAIAFGEIDKICGTQSLLEWYENLTPEEQAELDLFKVEFMTACLEFQQAAISLMQVITDAFTELGEAIIKAASEYDNNQSV